MIKRLLLATMLVVACGPILAKSFDPKTKPIEIVVPFPPGGANDKIARTVSEIFSEQGWKSVVVNKAGGGGLIGANDVAKAAPDGQTLLIIATSSLQSNLVFKADGLAYSDKSFVPVIPLTDFGFVLTTLRTNPINNYDKFKFYVKANPEKFNVGFFNANTANIYKEWAKLEKLPDPNIILYKGSTPQQTDLLGGHIPFVIDTYPAISPQVASGKVRVLATFDQGSYDLAKKLHPQDEIVNLAKQYPNLDINAWYCVWAPAGTPDSVIKEINEVINKALKTPKYKAKVEAQDAKFYGGTVADQTKINKKTEEAFKRIAK